MNQETRSWLEASLDILCCPRCQADLALAGEELRCGDCGQAFGLADNIPQLFWPNEWDESRKDVTEEIRAFYEETPFPNYDEFDSVGSMVQKARRGMFAKMLDDQVPPGTKVLECGCGTGQLSNFLSISNRTVFGTDICVNSLRLGQQFKEQNGLENVRFVQQNLFRPVFAPETFDLVISNGVLHHTSDPKRAFLSISRLVKPGGYIIIGLYHRYGRLTTDFRRFFFNLSGNRLTGLDPNLRAGRFQAAKWRAWFMDQYKHPHESKHTVGETLGWLREAGFSFVKSIPRTKLFQPITEKDRLFQPEAPGGWPERTLAELAMIRGGSREGGFFTVIGRKPAASAT